MSKTQEQPVYKTKYEKKLAMREQQKKQNEKEVKASRVIAIALLLCIIAAVTVPMILNSVKKNQALHDIYVKVGSHELTKLEYDFYYYSTINNYLTNYAQLIPYMGLDTTKDYDKQQYSDTLTWKDMFDQMTVEQIQQVKVLTDEAEKNGFSFDATADYDTYVSSVKETAQSTGKTVKEYYHSYFGPYADEANVAVFLKEGMLSSAYYQDFIAKNQPTDEEVTKQYEDNKASYDKVDYKSYILTSELAEDATDDEKAKALAASKVKADALKKDYEDGKEVAELTLTEGAQATSLPASLGTWLYDDARKAGDISVIEDAASNTVYLVTFEKKYFDEADRESIASSLAASKSSAYIQELIKSYEVTDVKGELKYLTAPQETPAAETTSEE